MPPAAAKSGFEIEGEFIPWHLTDKIKDLQLIDHFAKIPPQDFFAAVEDNFDRSRTPILAAMMATSWRHAHPEWSGERVIRFIGEISMTEVTFFDGEEETPEDEEEAKSTLPPDSPLSDEEEATLVS